jgi:hypothetical protein
MFRLTCYLLILLPIVASSAVPEERIVCSDCRSSVNATDYGNFAYNKTFGWDSIPQLDEHIRNGGIIRVVNAAGDHALVDINVVTKPYTFNIFNYSIFQITSVDNKLEITVQSSNGIQTSYKVFADSGRLQVGRKSNQSVIEEWGQGQQQYAYSNRYGGVGWGGTSTFIGGRFYFGGSTALGVVRITECDGPCEHTD